MDNSTLSNEVNTAAVNNNIISTLDATIERIYTNGNARYATFMTASIPPQTTAFMVQLL